MGQDGKCTLQGLSSFETLDDLQCLQTRQCVGLEEDMVEWRLRVETHEARLEDACLVERESETGHARSCEKGGENELAGRKERRGSRERAMRLEKERECMIEVEGIGGGKNS